MMGILPLQLAEGTTAASLGLTGRERFDIEGLQDGEAREVTVIAAPDDFHPTTHPTTGPPPKSIRFSARVRLDTPRERDYYRHGGILRYVLRRLLAAG
jgi:aconitate hydratase